MMIATLCMLATILITTFSIYLTFILQWQGPFRDLWEFVDDIERQFHGEWSWDYLIEAYGGAHRIFLPKLLFFADFYWLGGRNWLTITTALLCQFGYLFLIIRALQQTLLSKAERIVIASAFMLGLFSTTQISNFLYAMDVQWYMSNVFGLASLYWLSQQSSSWRWFGVLLFGMAAALCNFTGLMTLPVAAMVLLFDQQQRHTKWRWFLLLSIITACFLYIPHEKNSQQFIVSALQRSDSWQTSLYILYSTLQQILPYMLRYLASPLSREWPITGYVLSSAGIAVTIYYWAQCLKGKMPLSNWQKLCLYISTYIIASAFFTAFGRIIYPNSATAERYQTLVLPWLAALFGLLWPNLRKSHHHITLLLLCLFVYGCYFFPTQLVSAKSMVTLSQRVNLAHTAARAGILEPPYILATLSYPLIKNGINSVKDNDTFLRSHELGYFRHLPQFSLNKKVDVNKTLPSCAGYTSLQLDEVTHSWIIDGQLLANEKPVSDIILLQNNIVIGIGTQVGFDNSLLPPVWQPAETSRFRAFAHADYMQDNESVTALGITGNQVLCNYFLPR